ncbi:peptide-methionine (S)-S-oxide reductase MsrA [Thioalkalivibrio sp. AKL19]|uniref:peptide-methionine (S)-S-oxide reductase MsrA n=1 Tax=Thioalkalivibrio sp. AKL19 TaxID=1266914 RepID=UPI00040D4A6A|nr:peptide-methionine (S)-S-oxide reductase MsrA [Thioalkalivibrio sp. AKL19]
MFAFSEPRMPAPEQALPGRDEPVPVPERHRVLGTPLAPPYPEGMQVIHFGMGCFWGAERLFWQQDGVYSTSVGYGGGYTPNPTYQEVCSGQTGHTELVRVVFDPERVSLDALLRIFWEGHDPTQGMRQGNDVGTQYRSAIYTADPSQQEVVEASRACFQTALDAAGLGRITTEIRPLDHWYFAEDYHQQYLDRVPHGYCGLGGLGVACPVPSACQ